MKIWNRIFRRRSAGAPPTPPRNLRQSPGVLREVDSVLREVLATYSTEENFDEALKRVLDRRDPGSGAVRLPFFQRLMSSHARPEDQSVEPFTSARHLLEDLPEIYKF